MAHVSIIMPVYNGIQTIQKALGSLQAQTYSDLEIIVTDDQSTDGTYEFLQNLTTKDSRIKLFRTPKNLGNGGASRMAMAQATGDWVTILDADDWYEKNRIEAMLNAAAHLHADMVIDNLQVFDHALGKIIKQTKYLSTPSMQVASEKIFKLDSPLRRDSIGYCKPMMRGQFLRDHKINYWGKYRDNEDFTLLADNMLSGARAFIIPEAYYIYVHRISPTKRTVSASSHSANNSALTVAQACDELIDKYKITISEKAKKALLCRKQIFLTASVAHKQIEFLQQGQYTKAVGLFFKHPSLLSYRAIGIYNRLGMKLGWLLKN